MTWTPQDVQSHIRTSILTEKGSPRALKLDKIRYFYAPIAKPIEKIRIFGIPETPRSIRNRKYRLQAPIIQEKTIDPDQKGTFPGSLFLRKLFLVRRNARSDLIIAK